MAKLHELLAVDGNMKGQAQKCRTDLLGTFTKKEHLFKSKLVTFQPFGEGAEKQVREHSDIQTTVAKEIAWLSGILVKQYDASYAIDIANTQAKADIILEDGETLAKDVPATALLQLEKRCKELQELLTSIPTLDPASGFKPADDREKGIFAARERVEDSTKKTEEFPIIVPATKEHPAQVAKIVNDVKIGTILKQEWSSLITPATKAELLNHAEMLLRAVSSARARANEQQIDTKTHRIGKRLLDYVFQPLS